MPILMADFAEQAREERTREIEKWLRGQVDSHQRICADDEDERCGDITHCASLLISLADELERTYLKK